MRIAATTQARAGGGAREDCTMQLATLKLKDEALLRDKAYINGAWAAADDGRTIPVTNPATGEVIVEVPRMGVAETRRAIAGADAAFRTWRRKTGKERAAILRRWADLIMENQEDLAVLMTSEQGKPLAEARGEVAYGASFVEWFGEEAKRIYGDTIPGHQPDKRIVVLKEPIGVCAGITPWNFPIAMITRKAAPALAVGCTMVVKPAKQTPLCALALAELGERAGLPPGVLSIVTGDASVVAVSLNKNPTVRKLSFTGSTEIGKVLLAQCAGTVKKTSMELGGNAPFIVFDDADLDAAVEGAILYAFSEKLANAVSKLKVGPGLEPGVQIGPLIDMAAVEKVERHIAEAVSSGARLVVGGHRHSLGGSFFEPTMLVDVTNKMVMSCEETFGPVAGLQRFSTEDEAIRLSNDTEYGLAAYFYSRDLGRVWRVSEGLEYGIVGINTGIISTEVAPFGGMKESGIGREGSKYGVEDYLEIKYLCMGGIND